MNQSFYVSAKTFCPCITHLVNVCFCEFSMFRGDLSLSFLGGEEGPEKL